MQQWSRQPHGLSNRQYFIPNERQPNTGTMPSRPAMYHAYYSEPGRDPVPAQDPPLSQSYNGNQQPGMHRIIGQSSNTGPPPMPHQSCATAQWAPRRTSQMARASPALARQVPRSRPSFEPGAFQDQAFSQNAATQFAPFNGLGGVPSQMLPYRNANNMLQGGQRLGSYEGTRMQDLNTHNLRSYNGGRRGSLPEEALSPPLETGDETLWSQHTRSPGYEFQGLQAYASGESGSANLQATEVNNYSQVGSGDWYPVGPSRRHSLSDMPFANEDRVLEQHTSPSTNEGESTSYGDSDASLEFPTTFSSAFTHQLHLPVRIRRHDAGSLYSETGHLQPGLTGSVRSAELHRSHPLHEAYTRHEPQSPIHTKIVASERYQYKALKGSQFRLVKIAKTRVIELECELITTNFDDCPPYIAVSYAWGDPSRKGGIMLESAVLDEDGHRVIEQTMHTVTASLSGALDDLRQHLKDKLEEIWVWIDGLCIDQNNDIEKTQQVQMMTNIYNKAMSVAIWLGPEADNSHAAIRFLEEIGTGFPGYLRHILSSDSSREDIEAVVALFEREYWDRVWVVQEVFNAQQKSIYCGSSSLAWDIMDRAATQLLHHKDQLGTFFSRFSPMKRSRNFSQHHLTPAQVLVHRGPRSFPNVASLREQQNPFLEVMRECRSKLATVPQDKVYGVLGTLRDEVRTKFPINYKLPVKDVYTRATVHALSSGQLDVIREAIHFPMQRAPAGLPTWCPDWAYAPETNALQRSEGFPPYAASGQSKIDPIYLDDHRKLQITAIAIDTIQEHGVAVGTMTTVSDHLMAFLHWRALLLHRFNIEEDDQDNILHQMFSRTLCLDQIELDRIPFDWPAHSVEAKWKTACYQVFSTLIKDKLKIRAVDEGLKYYQNNTDEQKWDEEAWRGFLWKNFATRMMGRCFMITHKGFIGLGSGAMTVDDIVVVPYGCATPILLRPDGPDREYRYVGDVYVDGLMNGEALSMFADGLLEERTYVIH